MPRDGVQLQKVSRSEGNGVNELGGSSIVSDARGELPPGRPGLTEEAPHAPVKAAATGSVLGHRHQAAAAGSTPKHRCWNATTSAARMAMVEAAARKAGSLDRFRGPPALPLSPSLPPSSSPEVRKKSM